LVPGSEIHLSHFTPRTLAAMIERSGFEPTRVAVDDHHPVRTAKNHLKVEAARLAAPIGLNIADAMLVSARRR
jgi:hypothetical protein